mgnify:CR=1 FL=1
MKRIQRERGYITPVQNDAEALFEIKRVYYTYDIPSGAERGSHAHYNLHQLLLAASGSFTVKLDDGHLQREIDLARPHYALYLPPGLWRTISDFSSGSICLVLASLKYNPEDYMREYQNFLAYKRLRFVDYTRTYLEASYHWLREPEIKFLTRSPEVTREGQEKFFQSLPKRKDYWIQGIEYLGRPIGACGLRRIDHKQSEAEYFAFIGDKSLWDQKLGFEIFNHIRQEAIARGLKVVYTLMNPENHRAIRFCEKSGFTNKHTVDGVVRMDFRVNSTEYHDG